MPLLVGIAGGSGAGKTTLARMLADREPDRYTVVRLDDYYHAPEDVPWIDGIKNWERPEALRFDAAYGDLVKLKNDESIAMSATNYVHDQRQQVVEKYTYEFVTDPKPVVLFEGFLALYDERIRELLDLSIFLSIPIEESLKRRRLDPTKYSDDAYFRDILIPAHRQFVEPTEQFADMVVDVATKTAEEVYQEIRAKIEKELQDTESLP